MCLPRLAARPIPTCLLVLAAGLVVAAAGHADEPTRANAITLSLFQLTEPLYALRYERRLSERDGYAVMLGAASYSSQHFTDITRGELTLQYLLALVGGWQNGLRVGADARFGYNSGRIDTAAPTDEFGGEALRGSFGGPPVVKTREILTSSGRRERLAGMASLRWTSPRGWTLQLDWFAGVRHSAGTTTGGVRASNYDQWAAEARGDLGIGLAF